MVDVSVPLIRPTGSEDQWTLNFPLMSNCIRQFSEMIVERS